MLTQHITEYEEKYKQMKNKLCRAAVAQKKACCLFLNDPACVKFNFMLASQNCFNVKSLFAVYCIQ